MQPGRPCREVSSFRALVFINSAVIPGRSDVEDPRREFKSVFVFNGRHLDFRLKCHCKELCTLYQRGPGCDYGKGFLFINGFSFLNEIVQLRLFCLSLIKMGFLKAKRKISSFLS